MNSRHKIKSTLTKEQRDHYDSIKWLLNGGRGTGRTRTLAAALLETAVETNMEVNAFDHTIFTGPSQIDQCDLINQIKEIAKMCELNVTIVVGINRRIKIKAKRKL